MLTKKLLLGVVMTVSIGAAMTGCGGSGSGTTPPPSANTPAPTPLETASQSVSNFIAYIQALVSTDTAEPVAVDTLTAPSDDSADPVAVSL